MADSTPAQRLRWLPYLFAAGAVLWLVELTRFAAIVAAPAGRAQIQDALIGAGFHGDVGALLVVESALIAFLGACAVVLHGAAFYGLRRYRAWGWAIGVLVALAWSAVVLGIPVLVLLLQRRTRAAYGVP